MFALAARTTRVGAALTIAQAFVEFAPATLVEAVFLSRGNRSVDPVLVSLTMLGDTHEIRVFRIRRGGLGGVLFDHCELLFGLYVLRTLLTIGDFLTYSSKNIFTYFHIDDTL